MAVVNPTAAGESNEVDLSDKLATREVPPTKNTSHLGEWATTSHVIECEPERVLAWAVEDPANPAAIWRFRRISPLHCTPPAATTPGSSTPRQTRRSRCSLS